MRIRRNPFLTCGLYAAFSLVVWTGQTHAVIWTTLDFPGAESTAVLGIDGGQIVGSYSVAGSSRGFRYDGATWTTLDYPGSSQTFANGIDGGNIVGAYIPPAFAQHGYLYDGTDYVPLDFPGSLATIANGIDGTNVVGSHLDNAGQQGFLFDGMTWTSINYPGAAFTNASGISGGKIVGDYARHGLVSHGFVLDGSHYVKIDYPDSFDTVPRDIDGLNVIGSYHDQTAVSSDDVHGFLFDGVNWTKLHYPGSQSTIAYGIDGNTIVGQYFDETGGHGFVAVIPEPATLGLAAGAVVMCFGTLLRRPRFHFNLYPRGPSPMKLTVVMIVAAIVGLSMTSVSHATTLTFDQFVDAAKTVRTANNLPANQEYGDNVNDFTPAAPVDGQYVNYDPDGGLTPNVTVEYRWYYTLDPTDPNPGINGPGGVTMWDFGYGGLSYVAYANAGGSPWLSEIRFTPEPGYAVRINSLDYAGYLADVPNQTLKILGDPSSAVPQLLWAAGPDDTVVFSGAGNSAAPAVTGGLGETVSLLWGYSGNSGIDNVSFSQVVVPEPTTCGLAMIATLCLACGSTAGATVVSRATLIGARLKKYIHSPSRTSKIRPV